MVAEGIAARMFGCRWKGTRQIVSGVDRRNVSYF